MAPIDFFLFNIDIDVRLQYKVHILNYVLPLFYKFKQLWFNF